MLAMSIARMRNNSAIADCVSALAFTSIAADCASIIGAVPGAAWASSPASWSEAFINWSAAASIAIAFFNAACAVASVMSIRSRTAGGASVGAGPADRRVVNRPPTWPMFPGFRRQKDGLELARIRQGCAGDVEIHETTDQVVDTLHGADDAARAVDRLWRIDWFLEEAINRVQMLLTVPSPPLIACRPPPMTLLMAVPIA